MSDITHPPLHEEHTSTGLSSTKLAMWLFLASECMLFGGLITAYLLYRGSSLKARTRRTSSTSATPRCRRSCCWPAR